MPNEKYKRMAAVRPAATAEQDLLSIGSGKEIIGVIHVCNQDSSDRTFRVAVTDTAGGVAADGADFIRYDVDVLANLTHRVTIEGLQGPATIRIKASVADKISFVLMGCELT